VAEGDERVRLRLDELPEPATPKEMTGVVHDAP